LRVAADVDELERDGLAEAKIVGAIDLAHAAAPEERDDAVARGHDRAGRESARSARPRRHIAIGRRLVVLRQLVERRREVMVIQSDALFCLIAFAWVFVVIVIVAALAATRAGAWIGVVLATLLLILPNFTHGPIVYRGLVAFACTVCFACAIDFATTDRPATFARRLLKSFTFVAFIDPRVVSRQPPQLDKRALMSTILFALAAASAVLLWFVSPTIIRIVLGAIFILSIAEILTGVVRVATALFGITLRPVHDAPYRSRTILEFWSKRWNLVGARWFREHFYAPFRRTSVPLAMCVLFVASALMHGYLAVAIDWRVALSWAVFFLAQPVVIAIERVLRVRKWPPVAGRAWTMIVLISLLPLLLRPILA